MCLWSPVWLTCSKATSTDRGSQNLGVADGRATHGRLGFAGGQGACHLLPPVPPGGTGEMNGTWEFDLI